MGKTPTITELLTKGKQVCYKPSSLKEILNLGKYYITDGTYVGGPIKTKYVGEIIAKGIDHWGNPTSIYNYSLFARSSQKRSRKSYNYIAEKKVE